LGQERFDRGERRRGKSSYFFIDKKAKTEAIEIALLRNPGLQA